jgi:glycosyltransferase involved in cell wall biosynthesis
MEFAGSGVAIEPPVHTAEELDALYGWADVIILTSRFEGVPLSILEAQRAGCVALSTDVGAVGEIVAHGVDGLLVSAKADEETIVRDFCGHLQRLAGDRRLMRAIGLRAARRASRIRWERNLSQWIAHVEKQCETSAKARPRISIPRRDDAAMGPQ